MNKFEITTFRNNIEKFEGIYTRFWIKENNVKIEPLSNIDINYFGNKIKNYRGCFMLNELPTTPWENECGVFNLNDSTQNGSHWVAWKKINNTFKIYFDSFGHIVGEPPKELLKYLGKDNLFCTVSQFQYYNDPPICGHLCLEFIENYKKFI